MVFGLLTLGVSYQFGHVSLEATELGALGILSAYILGVAIVDHGVALSQAAPPVTTINVPPQVTVSTSGYITPIPASIVPVSADRSVEAATILRSAGAANVRTMPPLPLTRPRG